MTHRWATYADTHSPDFAGDTDIDHFAGISHGYHNGPRCLDCGRAACEHCEPEVLPEPCPAHQEATADG